MTDVTLVAADVSATQTEGSIINAYMVATGQTINVGDAVAKNGSTDTVTGLPLVVQADGNNSDWISAWACGIVVNTTDWYGSTVAVAGQDVSVCEFGPVYGFTNMTPGAILYVSDNAGKIATTPSATHPYVIGQAQAADTVFVNPHGTGSNNY